MDMTQQLVPHLGIGDRVYNYLLGVISVRTQVQQEQVGVVALTP